MQTQKQLERMTEEEQTSEIEVRTETQEDRNVNLSLHSEAVETRYYEINFGKRQPKIDRRTIESYVLGERRSRISRDRMSSNVTSGDFKVKEISTERVPAVNPSFFHRKDYVVNMIVKGTNSDFASLEQMIVLYGNGKFVQVREIPENFVLSKPSEESQKKWYSLSESAKNYLTIMSVPVITSLAITSTYIATRSLGMDNESIGGTCFLAGCLFGIPSAIYSFGKLTGEIK